MPCSIGSSRLALRVPIYSMTKRYHLLRRGSSGLRGPESLFFRTERPTISGSGAIFVYLPLLRLSVQWLTGLPDNDHAERLVLKCHSEDLSHLFIRIVGSDLPDRVASTDGTDFANSDLLALSVC